MEITIVLLTILGITIFLGGAYFMGNFMLDGFHETLQTRIVNVAYGILCWMVIAVVLLVCWGIYELVLWILPIAPDAEWLTR